jgi:tocopherol cyclase
MPTKKVNALFHPECYHGWDKKNTYFEGWYFKLISKDEKHAYAIIPGIAMDKSGNQQAFIQVLDGKKLTADYHKFDAAVFDPHPKKFELNLEKNQFTMNSIQLDLPEISGRLTLHDQVNWPSKWYSPGIMGPFAFVPFMQCYHGVLSMNHTLKGSLKIAGETIDFTGGRGYLEKDWGKSFPSGYIWMQTNHFSQPNISLKASVAKIPWMGSSFVGFIAGFYYEGKLIQFTTYNRTKLIRSFADEEVVELIFENKQYRLKIIAQRADATELASPIQGLMDGRISESMNANLSLTLSDKKSGQLLFEDEARNVAMEVAGNLADVMVG